MFLFKIIQIYIQDNSEICHGVMGIFFIVAQAPADLPLSAIPEMSTREMLAIVKLNLPDSQLKNTSYAILVNKISRHNAGNNSPSTKSRYSIDF